ncbi:MAG: DUF6932 family protein [Pyrinomonadaceae bacterium]
MKKWPDFNSSGDLPVGIHQATLAEVLEYFGQASLQRCIVAQRLTRIYELVIGTPSGTLRHLRLIRHSQA